MQSLARRIEKNILNKHNGSKRAALRELNVKCSFYARKADRYYGTSLHEHWRKVSRAYSTARFSISYFLELDESPFDCWESVDY